MIKPAVDARRSTICEVDYEVIDCLLQKLRFFAELPKETRSRLAKQMKYQICHQGSVLFQKTITSDQVHAADDKALLDQLRGVLPSALTDQQTPRQVFVIVAGQASLILQRKAGNYEFAARRLRAGDTFGDGPIAYEVREGDTLKLVADSHCDVLSIDDFEPPEGGESLQTPATHRRNS